MQRSGLVLVGLAAVALLVAAGAFLQVSSGPPAAAPAPLPAKPVPSAAVTPAAEPTPAPVRRAAPKQAPRSDQAGNGTTASTGNKKEERPPPPTQEELDAALPGDFEGVKQGLAEMRPMLAQCYQDALADVPDLAPRLDLSFTVASRHGLGRVRGVRIKNDDVDDPALVDCMAAAMEGLSFRPPDSPISLTVPMAFRAP